MKNFKRSTLMILFMCSITICMLFSCLATVNIPSNAKDLCSFTSNEIAGWFESGTITEDGVVMPANSVTFSDSPNCDFYKWSSQMFLWLTSPAPILYGGGGGLIFNSPSFYDVTPINSAGTREFIAHSSGLPSAINIRSTPVGKNGFPLAIENETFTPFEVMPAVINSKGQQIILDDHNNRRTIGSIEAKDKEVRFFDDKNIIINKPKPIIPENLKKFAIAQKFVSKSLSILLTPSGSVIDVESGQAVGFQVLMSQQGSLVYYQVTVNDMYAYFKTGVTNGDISANQFPTTATERDIIVNYANANGKNIVDPDALVIELKTSWVKASSIPILELKNFITLNATIPTFDKSDPDEWIPTGSTVEKLAMIGMHVVGSTVGHPEMIWATFEHLSVTPNAQYSYINDLNQIVSVPENTQGNWILCSSNSSGPFNQGHMNLNTSNHNIESISPFNISASDTKRLSAWGSNPSQNPNPFVTISESNSELISINNTVLNSLVGNDVRKNYIQTGSTWTIFGASPSGPFPSGNEVGTSRLANSSMETYMQSTNCFACHATNTVTVSSIWNDLEPLF